MAIHVNEGYDYDTVIDGGSKPVNQDGESYYPQEQIHDESCVDTDFQRQMAMLNAMGHDGIVIPASINHLAAYQLLCSNLKAATDNPVELSNYITAVDNCISQQRPFVTTGLGWKTATSVMSTAMYNSMITAGQVWNLDDPEQTAILSSIAIDEVIAEQKTIKETAMNEDVKQAEEKLEEEAKTEQEDMSTIDKEFLDTTFGKYTALVGAIAVTAGAVYLGGKLGKKLVDMFLNKQEVTVVFTDIK